MIATIIGIQTLAMTVTSAYVLYKVLKESKVNSPSKSKRRVTS